VITYTLRKIAWPQKAKFWVVAGLPSAGVKCSLHHKDQQLNLVTNNPKTCDYRARGDCARHCPTTGNEAHIPCSSKADRTVTCIETLKPAIMEHVNQWLTQLTQGTLLIETKCWHKMSFDINVHLGFFIVKISGVKINKWNVQQLVMQLIIRID